MVGLIIVSPTTSAPIVVVVVVPSMVMVVLVLVLVVLMLISSSTPSIMMAAAAPPATATTATTTTIAMAIAVAVVPSLVVIWIHDDEINTLYDGGLGVIPTIICCCIYHTKPRSVAHTTHNSHTKILLSKISRPPWQPPLKPYMI